MAKHPPRSLSVEAVTAVCNDLGFALDAKAVGNITAYLAMLGKWNKVMNLVGPYSWEQILSELIADSFHLAGFLRMLPLPDAPECRDLGAGAGLPGIPLRMLWQEGRYVLVELREKRALFLRNVLAALPLPGVTVFHGRVETFLENHPPAALTVSRAFMPWKQILSLIEAHTVSGGLCVFLTLTPLPANALPPGWKALAETAYTVGKDARYFWAIQKV